MAPPDTSQCGSNDQPTQPTATLDQQPRPTECEEALLWVAEDGEDEIEGFPLEEPSANGRDRGLDADADADTADVTLSATNVRAGTIASARFNILSTMVGGGCLSLPLAFSQSGNALVGPLLLLTVAALSDFLFRLLVECAIRKNNGVVSFHQRGKESFESIAQAAMGPQAYVFSMGLVTAMCMFGAAGYCVLLRDMLKPLTDLVTFSNSQWLDTNWTLATVVVIITPLCTLQTFTALQSCGAASMASILILGACIILRSVQCNLSCAMESNSEYRWTDTIRLFPDSPKKVLDAFPLYISCYVCHYSIVPVYNELQRPTAKRVSWWLRSTTWSATCLYMCMGIFGSMYATCTPNHTVQGNVLLDLKKDDPLVLVGRTCLAITITLAFPLLVLPARDIVLRSIVLPCLYKPSNGAVQENDLAEPLLANESASEPFEPEAQENGLADESDELGTTSDPQLPQTTFLIRLITATLVFWTAAFIASLVSSIDVVWDLLGSSLSILLSQIIPCASYLILTNPVNVDLPYTWQRMWSRRLCKAVLWLFIPLMVVSTANAVHNTFFG